MARGKLMRLSLYRKSAPTLSACAPAWCDRLLTTWYILLRRAVGLLESVPNEATPAMLTAGPIGSVGAASRSLSANCARVSSTVRPDSVSVLLIAIVWSTLSSPAAAVGALSPPAPRELSELTSYKL